MAEGDIDSVLDTLICNADVSGQPSVAHVSGDIYVICWAVSDTDGYMCTVEIDSAGQIADTVIETTHLEATACFAPHIIKTASNIFAYCYRYNLGHGIVRTIQIGDDGFRVGANIDSLEFEVVDCHAPRICEVSAGMFVAVYRDTNDDGKIATFTIDDSGNIGNAVSDDWVFDAGALEMPDVLKIADGILAFFYTDASGDGMVKTVHIDGGGDIAEEIIDSLIFEASTAYFIKAAHFTGNTYIAVYEDLLGHSWVTTMVIQANGQIGAAFADRLNFNTSYGTKPHIVAATSNVLAIAYRDSASTGEIYTFWCLSDGDITQAPRDTLAFESVLADFPFVFSVGSGLFAVAYVGEDSYITLKTFHVATAGVPKTLPFMGIG